MKASIIIPTKNNADILEKCLESIRNLDYPKEEIELIIVDGHSTDNTVEIAKKYGCKVVYENVGTRGGACNVGVRIANGEFVVFTDADCVVPKDWLKNLIRHFNDGRIASVGGPNVTPEDDTEFAKCVGVVLSFLSKLGARYGLNIDRVVETFHNSGCNVAYRKKAIEEVVGFNEKLITCEDEELDYRIKKKGYKILYTPDAVVYHYRRPDWKSFFKMAYKYAVGRMQAIKIHRKMSRWYHFTPLSIMFVIAALLILSLINFTYFWCAFSILVAGGMGIGVMSLYLGTKTKMRDVLTYYGLIAIWFWGYGLGMLRGLLK
jgi:GT2 family glycosyltransferase